MSTSSYIPIYFSDHELACRHCGQNKCTDALKQALDDYRRFVGRPVTVHDAYRCDLHNASVSLVSKSQHPKGTAADVEVVGLTLQEMYDAAKRVPAFRLGGIGVYRTAAGKVFIHVDVRDQVARWGFIDDKEVAASELVTV